MYDVSKLVILKFNRSHSGQCILTDTRSQGQSGMRKQSQVIQLHTSRTMLHAEVNK